MKKTCKRSKRWLSMLLCVLLIVPMLAFPAGAASIDDFKDVSSDAWYYDAVKYAVDKGIFVGMSADTFEPETALDRGMFVQTMANLTQNYDGTFSSKYFTDIPSGAWYEKAANWAYINLLISGTAEKTFSGTTDITREQAATILYAYAMRSGGTTNFDNISAIKGFSDFSNISDWAIAAMIWAVEQKVMVGVGENTLNPKGTLTRGQAAQLFTNIEGIIDDEPYIYGFAQDEDLGFDFEDTIGMTYGELVENLGEPVNVDKEYSGYYYYTFEAYPDVEYEFDITKGFDTAGDIPLDDTLSKSLLTTICAVMPDIVGLTFGEATKLTDGNLYIYYEANYYTNDKYVFLDGLYYAQNYMLVFFFDGTGNIDGDSRVIILTA